MNPTGTQRGKPEGIGLREADKCPRLGVGEEGTQRKLLMSLAALFRGNTRVGAARAGPYHHIVPLHLCLLAGQLFTLQFEAGQEDWTKMGDRLTTPHVGQFP